MGRHLPSSDQNTTMTWHLFAQRACDILLHWKLALQFLRSLLLPNDREFFLLSQSSTRATASCCGLIGTVAAQCGCQVKFP